MTNPLDPAVEAEVDGILYDYGTLMGGGEDLPNAITFDQAKTALTRLLLRERVTELEQLRRPDNLTYIVKNVGDSVRGNDNFYVKATVIKDRIATLEAQIKELE